MWPSAIVLGSQQRKHNWRRPVLPIAGLAIKQKWGEPSLSDHSVLTMQVATPAERQALEIVRSCKESLYIVEIQYLPAEQICRISAWNRGGHHRRFGKIPPPPGSAAS